jgi:hypothetical protein
VSYRPKRPVRRVFDVEGFRRPVVMKIYPDGTLELWESGTRGKFLSTVGKLYLLCVKTEVERELQEKRRKVRGRSRSLAG